MDKAIRHGASAAMAGGFLWLSIAATMPFIEWHEWSHHALKATPAALLFAGVVGFRLHAERRGGLGSLGRAGLDVCAVVFALMAAGGAFSAFAGVFGGAAPEFLRPMEVLLATGAILFGIPALRAGVLPRGGAVLVVVGAAAIFGCILAIIAGASSAMVLAAAEALFGFGWMWAGYGIRRGVMEKVAAPGPATVGQA